MSSWPRGMNEHMTGQLSDKDATEFQMVMNKAQMIDKSVDSDPDVVYDVGMKRGRLRRIATGWEFCPYDGSEIVSILWYSWKTDDYNRLVDDETPLRLKSNGAIYSRKCYRIARTRGAVIQGHNSGRQMVFPDGTALQLICGTVVDFNSFNSYALDLHPSGVVTLHDATGIMAEVDPLESHRWKSWFSELDKSTESDDNLDMEDRLSGVLNVEAQDGFQLAIGDSRFAIVVSKSAESEGFDYSYDQNVWVTRNGEITSHISGLVIGKIRCTIPNMNQLRCLFPTQAQKDDPNMEDRIKGTLRENSGDNEYHLYVGPHIFDVIDPVEDLNKYTQHVYISRDGILTRQDNGAQVGRIPPQNSVRFQIIFDSLIKPTDQKEDTMATKNSTLTTTDSKLDAAVTSAKTAVAEYKTGAVSSAALLASQAAAHNLAKLVHVDNPVAVKGLEAATPMLAAALGAAFEMPHLVNGALLAARAQGTIHGTEVLEPVKEMLTTIFGSLMAVSRQSNRLDSDD